jgi:Probable zinc-ribbon domain
MHITNAFRISDARKCFVKIATDMKRELADKDLRCATCGDGFVFSAGEQELFRLRGISHQPEHCPNCTRGRRVPIAANAASRGAV